jgi:hypothetical protein
LADTFRIIIHRSDESTHLKLLGMFDDEAASELIDALRIHSDKVSKIFIHTDSLYKIGDYNEQDFENRLHNSLNCSSVKILPTGRFSKIFVTFEGTCF